MAPNSLVSSWGKGVLFLSQGPPKRAIPDHDSVNMCLENPSLGSDLGLWHGKPNSQALGPGTERPYLKMGLRLRVTMRVCAQGDPQLWAWPHVPCRFHEFREFDTHRNSKVSSLWEVVLFCASGSTICRDLI